MVLIDTEQSAPKTPDTHENADAGTLEVTETVHSEVDGVLKVPSTEDCMNEILDSLSGSIEQTPK